MGQVVSPEGHKNNGGGFSMPPVPEFFNFAKDVVDVWAAKRPDATALWHVHLPSGGETKLTFRQISELSARAASVFLSTGIRPGDRVLLMLPRVVDWWVGMLGLIRMGAVPVPATLLLTARDVEYRLERAGIHAVMTSPAGVAKVGSFEGIKILAQGSHDGWFPFDDLMAKATAHEGTKTRADDPGIIYFTSATTGDPKMVLHSQASYGVGHRLTGGLWLDLKPNDLHWNISDLGWGKAAWSSFYGPWQMGACVFALDIPGKFDPALTLRTLEEFPITTWCAPPTALRLIVREELSNYHFAKLRHCVTAGEPLNPEVFNIWKEATGLSLYEAYGQSETVVLIGNCRSLDDRLRPGSMGKAIPGMNVTLVDESQRPVPAGHEGEIAITLSPNRPTGLFKEYWLSPEETQRAFVGDHYLTGDRAILDEDGYFWFIGRKDDVIKSSGYRIGPFEVESALMEHPSVLDVAVIGVPDPLRGQIVKAVVVLRKGVTGSPELKLDLQSHCKRLIAAYKYPREVEFVDELPKTTSGKTRRNELRLRA